MGFGYKTSWIAVRDRSPEDVAAALRLSGCEEVSWADGTSRAYTDGVYVSAPVVGWTLAHSAIDLDDAVGARLHSFPIWLGQLSGQLGEVHFYGTHRVSDYYSWGRAADGQILRAVAWGDSEMFVDEGKVTPEEDRLELGATSPREKEVMALAGLWSIDPTSIDDDAVLGAGIHGAPTESAETARFKALLASVRRR